jgi:hypothetical protein
MTLGASAIGLRPLRPYPEHVQLLLGMPTWVFWSVVLPWAICLGFSVWFCFGYMADDDLGRDLEEEQPHA